MVVKWYFIIEYQNHYTHGDGVKISVPIDRNYIYEDEKEVEFPNAWKDNGRFTSTTSGKDIAGMWEEPSWPEEIAEKAFKESLVLYSKLLWVCFRAVGKP